jgi:hypothetical protein
MEVGAISLFKYDPLTTTITDIFGTGLTVDVTTGVWTFPAFPVTPSSPPTTDYQVANKKYIDDSLGANKALSNLASVAINAALVLGTSDAFALGSATKMWSDLFLADGGVINFNNGNATITHSAGILTFSVFPVTPSAAPDADYEVANKKYVDDATPTSYWTRSGIVISPFTAGDIIGNYLSGIAATPTDALLIENITNATAGVPVQMPGLAHFKGYVWETTGGTNQAIDVILKVLPVSGATAGILTSLGMAINGGSYVYPFTIDYSGNTTLLGNLVAKNYKCNVLSKTADYTITTDDDCINVTCSTVDIVITLPTAVGNVNRFTIKKLDDTAFVVHIVPNGTESIDDQITYTLNNQYDSVSLYSNNANWFVR